MINWLGQEVKVGDIVYRGARDGNTSSFKIGTVVKVNLEKQTVRVEWKVEQGVQWINNRTVRTTVARHIKYESFGSPSIDTLVVMPEDFLDKLTIV